ncbi:MAG: GHMP kinase [Candidatus Aminicenantes bacterium]|nr:GHMP kinase [Candidatus Aminicenantes bacterium]
MKHDRRDRVIHSSAPIRINDIGGWTDTWFSGEGKVVNMSARPGVDVFIRTADTPTAGNRRIRLHAVNYRDTFSFDPDRPDYSTHPLLQAAVSVCPPAGGQSLDISIQSAVPAGISTGTSAAVCVALLGALLFLRGDEPPREDIARMAHRVETETLGWQSGIQDQISATCGGIRFIHMPSYPEFRSEVLLLPESTRVELEKRLCLIDPGGSHSSTALHEQVIQYLEKKGAGFLIFKELRDLADRARLALLDGDLSVFGRIMSSNTELQRALHADLISPEADRIIKTARSFGAAGWKVNGAGGRGGSLSILGHPDQKRRQRMKKALADLGGGIRELPIFLDDRGLVTEDIHGSGPEPFGHSE